MEPITMSLPESKWTSKKFILAGISLIAITLGNFFDASYEVKIMALSPLFIVFLEWLYDLIIVIRTDTKLTVNQVKDRFLSRKFITSIATLICGLFTLITGKEVSDVILNMIPMVYVLLQAILDGISQKKE